VPAEGSLIRALVQRAIDPPAVTLDADRQAKSGDTVIADDEILQRTVYDELRGLAAVMLADQRPGHTLQPTALVNEAYLRMPRQSQLKVESRSHFFKLAAKIMRQVLVDHARAKDSQKRGGNRGRVTLDGQNAASPDSTVDLLALDDALSVLSTMDERKARLVELRVFAGTHGGREPLRPGDGSLDQLDGPAARPG
jgi:RNA polymerase sigma factor (TIGR02999 family)